jgi:hypothetical protein
MAPHPSLVVWSDHALFRAAQLGVARSHAEAALLDGHTRRTANPGSGDWMTSGGGLTLIYDWPTEDGALHARLVTLWRAE